MRKSVELARHRGFGGDKKLFLEIISGKHDKNKLLTLQEFTRVFGIKDKQLATDLFHAFDSEGSGTVNLDELTSMADLLEKGDPNAKVDCALLSYY